MSNGKVPIHAVERSFTIIEALKDMDGAGVTELARHLDLPKSTVHVHLQTLKEIDFVVETNDEYHVGLQFLGIGEQARNRLKIYDIARDELNKLADETGELANLLVEEHGYGVHIYKAKGDNAIDIDTFPGKQIPLHQTSRGKAYLSCLPDDEIEEILKEKGLPAATENTITDTEELRAELRKIRERGYALDRGERIKGLHCVAAPITDEQENPVAAISIAGPKGRVTGDYLEDEFKDVILNTANVIELDMTFS